MAANAMAVVGIEWMVAAQGCEFHAPLATSAPLSSAIALLRQRVPALDEDRHLQPDLQAAIEGIARGDLADLHPLADLPGLA